MEFSRTNDMEAMFITVDRTTIRNEELRNSILDTLQNQQHEMHGAQAIQGNITKLVCKHPGILTILT